VFGEGARGERLAVTGSTPGRADLTGLGVPVRPAGQHGPSFALPARGAALASSVGAARGTCGDGSECLTPRRARLVTLSAHVSKRLARGSRAWESDPRDEMGSAGEARPGEPGWVF
jgi:hypothetical protein